MDSLVDFATEKYLEAEDQRGIPQKIATSGRTKDTKSLLGALTRVVDHIFYTVGLGFVPPYVRYTLAALFATFPIWIIFVITLIGEFDEKGAEVGKDEKKKKREDRKKERE